MFRLFAGPMIVGIMVVLLTYFVSPLIISDPGIVAIVAGFGLNFSNLLFATTPPLIADYVASLNLVVVAVTVGLLVTVVIQLLVIIWGIFGYLAKWMVACLQKFRKEDEPSDLPAIDMDSSFKSSSIGKGVYGRGLDSIDQER